MELKAHIDAELSKAQLEDLARRLKDKRSELADRIEEMEQQIVLKDDCSHADAADIDAAIRRIAVGNYGVSEKTGEPIAYERLLLIPWARIGAEGDQTRLGTRSEVENDGE